MVITKAQLGTWIMFIFSLIGVLISLFNFFSIDSPIYFTAGAELVILTSFAIAVLSALLYFFRNSPAKWERTLLYILILGILLGTIFAAFLLEASVFFFVMCIVFLGWLIQVFKR